MVQMGLLIKRFTKAEFLDPKRVLLLLMTWKK
jgi:hypothetical protein